VNPLTNFGAERNATAVPKVLPFRHTGTAESYDYEPICEEQQENYRQQVPVREANSMDNNDLLSKYIEKVDRDQSDLRTDIRESERRTSEHIAAVEERMDGRLNRIEDLISKQTNKIDETASKQSDKINKMGDKLNETRNWVIGVCITTIFAIAAMVIAIITSK
jgi:hypothetical protein